MIDLTTTRQELATIHTYEARIDLYKEQIVGGYIGIGRTLIEAKAAGVVPHGQWETWATEHTGMSARNVQRCMQIAREIDEESPLARLDMSKALLLISSGLDEDRRDEIGAAAAEEQVSVTELKRRIEDARAAGREQARMEHAIEVGETKRRHEQELRRLRDEARETATRQTEHYQTLLNARDQQIRQADARIEAAAASAREDNARALEAQAGAYRQMIAQRDAQLQEVDARIAAAVSDAEAASQAEVAQLRARLDKADADRRAAQQELLTIKSTRAASAAAGVEAQGLNLDRFIRATRSYLMEVGELPYMGTALANADGDTRYGYQQQLQRIADWLHAAQQALKVMVVEPERDLEDLLRDGLFDREVLGG